MSDYPFDPNPRFYNHMCHWRPWAEQFKANDDREKALLANMLGSAMDEIDRLRRIGQIEGKARSQLIFAHIELVDKLCIWCSRKPKPFGDEKIPSFRDGFESIKQLNRWRADNKLNIKAVDVG